jgi:glycosyltransferase involved in cell wall biosynthesis
VDVTICIATYGDPAWSQLATLTALPSALWQAENPPVVMTHGATLAAARNDAAAKADTEWLIYCDADDQLAPGYIAATAAADGDLRAPRLFLGDDEVGLTARDIEHLNPCPVGTAIRKQMLFDCGGWPEFRAWEDWALFLRAYRRGATIAHTDAVYRAGVNPAGRNSTIRAPRRLHREIRAWA